MDNKCARRPSYRSTVNIIEYIPVKPYLQQHSVAPRQSRPKSPDPHLSPTNFQRHDVYLNLVNSNSKFDVETVFAKAPAFFRKKIGLPPARKKDVLASVSSSTSATGNGVTGRRSTQSLYRPRVSPNSEFQANKGMAQYSKMFDGSGDGAAEAFEDIGTCSKASLVSNKCSKTSTTFRDGPKGKTKPEWRYVRNCGDTFTPFKEYFVPKEPLRRRPEPLKAKRPFENSCDEDDDFCSYVNHNFSNTVNRSKKEKADSGEQVFAVNGSVVLFEGFDNRNCTNWFAEPKRGVFTVKKPDYFRRELNFTGFTSREISMKVYGGNRLVIEGSRPRRGQAPAKDVQEVVDLPDGLNVESLFITRSSQGVLIIERALTSARS